MTPEDYLKMVEAHEDLAESVTRLAEALEKRGWGKELSQESAVELFGTMMVAGTNR